MVILLTLHAYVLTLRSNSRWWFIAYMVVYRKEITDLDSLTGNTAAQSTEETTNEGERTINTSLMVPRAILTSRPNSHPFQERHLGLDQPIKIGRSVARCRPAPNNAIFDCKVLSRNHALLWHENGKFYLQDTKSSNGTFINNQRLSKGSEESPAREVCSGDIVQFGVDVVENSRKVVHGCVVATLKLYLPDGKEAKASTTTSVLPCSPDVSITIQELYQLGLCLQEALQREQILENKLGTLQKVVANTQDESDIGWKALIEEDRLLSRIETLESQLQTCGKNVTEEKLREDVLKLQEDKDVYQNAAKESLKKILQEKLEAIRKVQDLESSLSNAETECAYLREQAKNTEQELQVLLERISGNEKEINDLTKQLEEAEQKYQELTNQTTDDKQELESKIEAMQKTEEALQAKIESLEAENDFSKEQLESVKARFDLYKNSNHPDEKIEKNGLLLPCDDELETSEKESEKKGLIQELSSEVNRLELELQRVVEENNRNEVSLTIKYNENDEHHTNGDIKSSEYINHLQAEIQQLKKLLAETRDSKKGAEAELVYLKSQLDEAQNNAKKVRDEYLSVQQQLITTKQLLKDKTEQLSKLESQLNLSQSFDGKIAISEKDTDDLEQLEENLLVENLRDQLHRTQQQLKESQNEAQQMKRKAEDLYDEMQRKKVDNKTVLECQSLRDECRRHFSRIQALESEVKKYRNENIRLDADNKCLQEMCAKLETAKLALENQSDDYWKEQVTNEKSRADKLNEELLYAYKEIVHIKERYAEVSEEKVHINKEKEALSEQLQLLSVRSRAACLIIPVCVILLATMLAFYCPSLAFFTATSDQT